MSDSKEIIQARLLANIDDSFDKSEGSFFYDAEMPVAIEFENMDKKADSILDKGFADTAAGTWLDKICNERGITRKLATKATTTVLINGTLGSVISLGDKVASDTVNFISLENKIIDDTGQIIVNVECENAGIVGNMPSGSIKYFPITLQGLVSVTNPNAVIDGYNEETDAELRQRYYDKVRSPATSGNKAQYLIWAKEVTGVGDARVFPLWNGNGTVKVVIIDSNKRTADNSLIANVSQHIEDNRPIGATVSVISATEKTIYMTVTLTIDTNNYTVEQTTAAIEANLIEYFKTIAFKETYVSYAKIGNIIFDTQGVLDYSNLQVNNGTANITIGDEEVASLGGVVVG